MRSLMFCTCVLLVGCASIQYPFSATALARRPSGPALVAYLEQPDATPAVCQFANGFVFDEQVADALVDGVLEKTLSPAAFRGCVERALKHLKPEQTATLFDSIFSRGYVTLLRNRDIETTPAMQERLATLHHLYLERPTGFGPHEQVFAPAVESIEALLREWWLGPVAKRFATELLDTVVLERRAVWRGRAIDLAAIEALAMEGNVLTLTRLSLRLSPMELRDEARRRLVQVQIAVSAFPEVRAEPVPVENQVLMSGANRVMLRDHAVLNAWVDSKQMPSRTVVVRQLTQKNKVSLIGVGVRLLPEISFRNVLWAQLQTISRPITVCGDSKELDPTPCLDEGVLSVDQPLVHQDGWGAFHVNDQTDLSTAIALASSDRFPLPVKVGGQLVASLDWGLRFERPGDLLFIGSGVGPSLGVRVDQLASNRFVFTVNNGSVIQRAVLEAGDLSSFRVVSKGGNGVSGRSGSDGSNGSSGAQCQNGSRGSDGGDGSNGGDGHDGGAIDVVIACGAVECSPQTLAAIERVVQSVGGWGGSGGSGGSGGRGGSGGSSRAPKTHTDKDGRPEVDDPGCSAGSSGSSGSDGRSGSSGNRGNAGPRRFTVIAPPSAVSDARL